MNVKYTSRYNVTYLESNKFGFENITNLTKPFWSKFNKHHNAKFQIKDNETNKTLYDYLTYNTNVNSTDWFEDIGTTFVDNEIKTQFLNYNYQVITNQYTDTLLLVNKKIRNLERGVKMDEIIQSSNKIEVIQENISRSMEFFKTCVNHTQNTSNCLQSLIVNHSEHFNLVLNLIFYKAP